MRPRGSSPRVLRYLVSVPYKRGGGCGQLIQGTYRPGMAQPTLNQCVPKGRSIRVSRSRIRWGKPSAAWGWGQQRFFLRAPPFGYSHAIGFDCIRKKSSPHITSRDYANVDLVLYLKGAPFPERIRKAYPSARVPSWPSRRPGRYSMQPGSPHHRPGPDCPPFLGF